MATFPSQTTGLGVAAKILVQGNVEPVPGKSMIPGYNPVVLSISGANGPTSFQLNPELVDVANNPVTPGTAFTLTAVAGGSPGPLTLTAAAAAVNGSTVYTGTITGGGSNAYIGQPFVVAGFDTAANNGTFECVASTTTTLTLSNANGVLDTHAATATSTVGTAVYTGTITGGGSNAFAGVTFDVAGFVTNPQNNGSFICTASSTTTLTLQNNAAVTETHAATATSEELTNSLTYVAYGFKSSTPNTYLPSGTPNAHAVCTVSATGLISAGTVEGGSVVEVSYPTFNNSIGNVVSSGNIMNGLPIAKIYASVNVTVLA